MSFESVFSGFTYIPVNYTSVPAGLVSSLIFEKENNVLMRMADRADRALAERIPALGSRFRSAIFVLRKRL